MKGTDLYLPLNNSVILIGKYNMIYFSCFKDKETETEN